ncbi:MAG: hypothetical protein CL961_03315 [Euryarchaeota archaeon]|nr:hypothetical protein [Euryarchaeota archaeon]
MPSTNLKQYDSVGGFSVSQTPIFDETRNAKNINSLELKSDISNTSRTDYVVTAVNDGFLSFSDASRIQLPSKSVNFITANVIALNTAGTGAQLSEKIESTVLVTAAGDVQHLSSLRTIIKDSIPETESWSISPFDAGLANAWTYQTSRVGTSTVRWYGYVSVVSGNWV